MAKQTKKKFTATKAVKALARATVGTPPSTRAIPDAKAKQERRSIKHKTTLAELLDTEE